METGQYTTHCRGQEVVGLVLYTVTMHGAFQDHPLHSTPPPHTIILDPHTPIPSHTQGPPHAF